MTKSDNKQLPGVFATSKRMRLSDGRFTEVSEDGAMTPVLIVEQGYRGTQNQSGESTKSGQVVTIGTSQVAKLGLNSKTLGVETSVYLLPLSTCIHSCSSTKLDREEVKAFKGQIKSFIKKSGEGVEIVAKRLTRNIFNGRWLYRNCDLAGKISIECEIRDLDEKLIGEIIKVENALAIPRNNFDNFSESEEKLGREIADQLLGKSHNRILIKATLQMRQTGEEVYPSENYIAKPKSKADKEQYARSLYKVPHSRAKYSHLSSPYEYDVVGEAAIRAEKIGAAIRTIDIEYPGFKTEEFPISVEPLGASIEENCFFRPNADAGSVFGMLKRLDSIEPTSDEGLFVLACLVRGGVFGESEKGK